MRGIVSGLGARAATALAVVSATFLATASGAGAATINYVFEPGSSITATEANPPNASYTETITGSFTFNTSTDALSAVNVTLSGSPSYFSPNPIIFVDPFAPFNAGNTNFGFANASTLLLALEFQGLGGSSSPLAGGAFYNGQGNNNAFAGPVSGGVETATTPLPAALPLFVTGLGAMGLFGWRRKRKNAAAIAAA